MIVHDVYRLAACSVRMTVHERVDPRKHTHVPGDIGRNACSNLALKIIEVIPLPR